MIFIGRFRFTYYSPLSFASAPCTLKPKAGLRSDPTNRVRAPPWGIPLWISIGFGSFGARGSRGFIGYLLLGSPRKTNPLGCHRRNRKRYLEGRINVYRKTTKLLEPGEEPLQCRLPLEVRRNNNPRLLQGELEGSE